MISKELLSEVLNLNMWKTDSLNISIDENKVYCNGIFLGDLGYQQSSDVINIYELANKCKVWAFVNGYYLTIYNDAVDIVLKTNCKVIKNITDGSFNYSPMLVFKACQWILDNKESK